MKPRLLAFAALMLFGVSAFAQEDDDAKYARKESNNKRLGIKY